MNSKKRDTNEGSSQNDPGETPSNITETGAKNIYFRSAERKSLNKQVFLLHLLYSMPLPPTTHKLNVPD
jgi:hypothetical protein